MANSLVYICILQKNRYTNQLRFSYRNGEIMQRISLDDNIKLKNTIVTIGKFDGIHKGHEKLLEVIVNNANGRQKVVLTFETTPSAFLNNNANKTIVTEEEKQILCEQQGVDVYMKMQMIEQLTDQLRAERPDPKKK